MTREERLTAIKTSAADLAVYLDGMARQLLSLAHPSTPEAEVLDRLSRAFRCEASILPRIATLAELAPTTARAGRDFGQTVREIAA